MPPESRQYTDLQAVGRSFFSGPLYRDVARNWPGIAMMYLLILLALTLFLVVVRFQCSFYLFIKAEYRGALDNVPPFAVKNGEVSLEAAQPCEIRNNDTGKLIAVIDTTGGVASLRQTEAKFLLTKTRLMTRKEGGDFFDRDLSRVKDLQVDGPTLKRWIRLFHLFLPLVFFPAGLMLLLALRLALAYAAAGIGYVLAPRLGASLGYGALLRLAVVAQTPDILLGAAADVAGISIPFFLAARLALTGAVFVFAIRANAGAPVLAGAESEWSLGWPAERSEPAPPSSKLEIP